MKAAAIVSVVLLIACLLGIGVLYATADMAVESIGVIAVEAATQPDLFNQLRQQVETGSVLGTAYTSQSWLDDASNYQFYTYTIRLRNDCFVTADMIEAQVTPMDGDILQIGDYTVKQLPARTTGDLQVTILTAVGMHPVREINVTYYVWGMPFTLKTTYGQ
ncbi:MAG: hypothetical protein J1E43_02255 [Christensenellaceae bacterium]|nr:hypothetical protein [Christensenellaceae bacterium]